MCICIKLPQGSNGKFIKRWFATFLHGFLHTLPWLPRGTSSFSALAERSRIRFLASSASKNLPQNCQKPWFLMVFANHVRVGMTRGLGMCVFFSCTSAHHMYFLQLGQLGSMVTPNPPQLSVCLHFLCFRCGFSLLYNSHGILLTYPFCWNPWISRKACCFILLVCLICDNVYNVCVYICKHYFTTCFICSWKVCACADMHELLAKTSALWLIEQYYNPYKQIHYYNAYDYTYYI